MYRMAFSMVENADDAKDAVNQVFAQIWRGKPQVAAASVRGYLLAATRNQCLHLLRSRQLQRRMEDELRQDMAESESEERNELLQQLRQVIENKKGGNLPVMTVCDRPTLPLRGVIEGFYGPPWPHEVRLDLIDFMGRNKMNLYVYGPKDDPYHRTPSWREPYPADEAARIAELVKACKENMVEFAWAIHPGGDIRWDDETMRTSSRSSTRCMPSASGHSPYSLMTLRETAPMLTSRQTG